MSTHITYIKPSDDKCQECGQVEELRPYGKGGKFVCFDCMMKDEAEGKRQFDKMLNQPGVVIIDARKQPLNDHPRLHRPPLRGEDR